MLRHVSRYDNFYNRKIFRFAQDRFFKAASVFLFEKQKRLNEETRQTEVKMLSLVTKNYLDN